MAGKRRRAVAALVALPFVAALGGCGGNQNALAPASHQSAAIASLFWWMTGVAFLGLGLVVALLLWSWKRRDRRGLGGDTEGVEPGEQGGWLAMAEAAEVATWTAVAELAGRAEVDGVAPLAAWALSVHERHLQLALDGAARLASLVSPLAPRFG
jgi:hypothetical protein